VGALKTLEKHTLVLIDTCVWIYHLESHPRFGGPAGQVLSAVQSGVCHAVSSELTLMELIAGPLYKDRQDIADEYELLLTHFPNLTLFPVTRDVLLSAARIRARSGLRTPDAIILASAHHAGAQLLVSNDRDLARDPALEVLNLSDACWQVSGN
jgi:predicted nucleic acid-binding protein